MKEGDFGKHMHLPLRVRSKQPEIYRLRFFELCRVPLKTYYRFSHRTLTAACWQSGVGLHTYSYNELGVATPQ